MSAATISGRWVFPLRDFHSRLGWYLGSGNHKRAAIDWARSVECDKPMIARIENWEFELERFLNERRSKPFAWGSNDCCLFACDAVSAITGIDLAASFRGKYASAAKAYKVIRTFAGGGLRELADKVAEQHAIAAHEFPLLARRGDVALFETAHGATLGIVALNGAEIWAPDCAGLAAVALMRCSRAWRIG